MEIIGNVIINLLNNGYFWWQNFEKNIQLKSILKSQFFLVSGSFFFYRKIIVNI